MKQKILTILLSMIMLFTTSIYAKESEKQSVPGRAIFVMAPDYPIQVQSKKIGCQNNRVKMNIKVPQITGLRNKKFEKELNSCLLKDATMRKKQLIQEATNNAKQSKILGIEPKTYELIRNHTIKQSKDPYIGIGIFEYSYTGGAHGLSYQKYIVINKDTSEIVNLKDLFKEDYKEVIKEQILAQIPKKKGEGVIFFDDVNHTIEITDQQDFYIDDEGNIVIVFNVYEIAPYVSGVIEFTIPKESLKNIIIDH